MKSKLKIIIPVGIALIAIALAFVFIRFTPSETVDISGVIDTAQQYLIDQKYEQAIAEFEKAIQIDPMNVDAYIGIAQAYEAIGDTEKAIEWLQKGYDLTGDTSLKEEIDRLSVRSAEVETTTTTTVTTTTTQATTTTADTTITTVPETTTVTTLQNVENQKAIEIKNRAYDEVIDKFIGYNYGKAGTTEYYYFEADEDNRYGTILLKMVYGDSDEPSGNWETESSIYNGYGILTINKREYTNDRYMSCISYNNDKKEKCEHDGWMPATIFTFPQYISSDFDFESFDGDVYIYKHKLYDGFVNDSYKYKLFIYVKEDNINKIIIDGNEWYRDITFEKEDNVWVATTHERRFFPYKSGLPDGYSKEDFEVSDTNYETVAEYSDLY